jgi:hypothetical protein
MGASTTESTFAHRFIGESHLLCCANLKLQEDGFFLIKYKLSLIYLFTTESWTGWPAFGALSNINAGYDSYGICKTYVVVLMYSLAY